MSSKPSKIVAVLGSESHTTSRGWANLYINGKRVSHRDAISKEWQTKYGDKHASWCECVFTVSDGDEIRWETGANSGSRGSNRTRINQSYTFALDAKVVKIEGPGYPATNAELHGRLVLKSDAIADTATAHKNLVNSL